MPAPPSVPAGWRPLVGFRVYADLAVGEMPRSEDDDRRYPDGRRDTLVFPAVPGAWYGFARETPDGMRVVAAHASIVRAIHALLGTACSAGAVNVEGGTLHIVDTEVRDDASYRHALEEGDGRGRALALSTGGDGAYEVAVTRAGDRVVLITVEVDV